MASGNYLIGENLSLEGFKEYVQPALQEQGYTVQDKIKVSTGNGFNENSLLVSIVGEDNIENKLNDLLVEVGEHVEKVYEESERPLEDQIALKYQISGLGRPKIVDGNDRPTRVEEGYFVVLGTYEGDDTASELFPTLAQKYLLKDVERNAEEVMRKVKGLLGKKLSDL